MTHYHRKRRRRLSVALVALSTVIVVLLLAWWRPLGGDPGSAPDSAGPSVGRASATASATPSSTSTHEAHEIVLDAPPRTLDWPAKLPVSGSYLAAAPGTILRVQLLNADGTWVGFPLPTTVDESGRFSTYVELGQRGTSRLRVTHPASGATSDVVSVEVR